MIDQQPIVEARTLLQDLMVLLESEQQSFLTLRCRTDIQKVLECLSALQTVKLPPVTLHLSDIDTGEPTAYDSEIHHQLTRNLRVDTPPPPPPPDLPPIRN